MLNVTTRVVNHCILSHHMPQDAVGGQFDMVYKEMVTVLVLAKYGTWPCAANA